MNSSNAMQTLFHCLLTACCALGPLVASASEPAQSAHKTFASVSHLKGELSLVRDGETRSLKKDDKVFVGDKVRAAAGSEAVLQTGDAGIVAVRPHAEFIVDSFAAEGKNSDHQILRLLTGSLRIITGWIGQINPQAHRVVTPNATIGIRGTDHEPYVLPADQATSDNPEGTYDKVNRGATLLDANGGKLAIDGGRVGFARDAGSSEARKRAIITLLVPVLLDKIPDFYLPGVFDQALDTLSANAEAGARRQLERLRADDPSAPPSASGNAPLQARGGGEPTTPKSPSMPTTGCSPKAIASAWLGQLDQAILRKDSKTLLDLFAPDIVAKATVRSGDKLTTAEFSRDEMARSMIAALANLQQYRQQRPSLEAALADGETVRSCRRLIVTSISIEHGVMNDKPFRFESLEEYLLEKRNGKWLAIETHTTQR